MLMLLWSVFDLDLTCLQLSIGPSGNLDDHVEDGLLLVGIERDVVEGRDGSAILLDVAAVIESVFGSKLANRELGGPLAVGHGGHL